MKVKIFNFTQKMALTHLLIGIYFLIYSPFASAQPLDNSLLWKISGNNLKEPSYLYGTIHIVPKKSFVMSEIVKKSMKKCKVLVLETNIDIPIKKQIEIARMMMFTDGKTIDDFMESDYKFSDFLRDSLHLSDSKIKTIISMKPVAASAMVYNELIDNPVSYEKEFLTLMKKNKMSFAELEAIEYQLQVLDSLDINEQIKVGFNTDNLSLTALNSEFEKLISAYRNQDLNELNNLQNGELEPKYLKMLLTNRNANWVIKLNKMMFENSLFIAVGAGHLPGENGLIQMLRKNGYTVESVK